MEIFPSPLRDLWNTWELPAMVIFSFFLQVVLIPMGYKRKYSSNNCLKWLLWLAYLSADWAATVALGMLSNDNGGGTCRSNSPEPSYVIRALWAPFLLLHLGGPDTITAYSIQDNELWLRHLLGLLTQVGFAFYVFLRALQPTAVNFVAIPVFVAGIIKYGERTWALRSASTEHLRDQLVTDCIVGSTIFPSQIKITKGSPHFNDLYMLHIAHGFFLRNKWVFADLALDIHDLKETLCCFEEYDSETAFKVIELELGFMHDFFYTKASLIHSFWGALLRLASLSSTIVAIAVFSTTDTHRYPPADVRLTFFLLFGSLGIEIYSFCLLLFTDWSVIRLTKTDNLLARLTFKAICGFGWSIGKRRWSNSVPQYNLITCCFQDINDGYYCKFLRSSYTSKIMAASRPISDELGKRILEQVKEKLIKEEDQDHERNLRDWIRRKRSCYDRLGWSLELDTDQSILLWHIATDLCYHSDSGNIALNFSILEDSVLLSNFLTYILVRRHSLFPNGMSQMRFHSTVSSVIDFLQTRKSINHMDACKSILLDLDLEIEHRDVKENGSSSVFHYGCLLAQELQELGEDDRWEMISHVWVEMLVNISSDCKFYDHIEQLGHGGDLLTHVWLLMHHFGYVKQAYNVTTADYESEIQEFHHVVKNYNAAGSLQSRIKVLVDYLEGLR